MRVSCCLLWLCSAAVAVAQDYPRDRRALFQYISSAAQNIKVTAEDVALRAAATPPDSETILDEIQAQRRASFLIQTLFWRIADLRLDPVLDKQKVYWLQERADDVGNTATLQLVAMQEHHGAPNWKKLRSLAKTQAKRAARLAEEASRID